jgi:hypothetical protein
MAQPSKAGAVFLTIFALPFLGGGLFFLYAQFVAGQNSKSGDRLVGAAIALFFVFIGAGLILASVKGYGLLKKQASLQDANPLSPWLWRTDWAARRAESQCQKSYIGAWVLAALGNLFLFPFMFGMIPQMLRHSDSRAILVLGFCSLGVVLIARAIRATIRHDRFGNSYFEFDSLPFAFGRRATGRIHLRFETQAAHGIDLRLRCVRRVTTGSGNNRSTSNITLWQADKNVPSGAVGPGPLGRAIPVDFELPAEGLATDHNDSNDQVLWLLHAQADVPGVDYSDDFELPVFRTADSPQPASNSQSQVGAAATGFGFATTQVLDGDSGAVPQPAHTKVVVSMRDGGTEFYFPPFRNPARALMLLLVAAGWSGAVYALFHSRAPLFFAVIFALADLFIIFGFFHVSFGSARIFVGNGEILSRRGVFGIGGARRTPFSEVASVVAVANMQQGGNSDNSVHSIRMVTNAGKKITLADEISSREEARWAVSQIESLAGLKIDTRVEVDLPIGVRTRPLGQAAGPVFTNSKQSTSTSASLAVFIMMVAGMLGFMAWRMSSFTSRRNSSRAAAAPRTNPATRRVFSAPMADADVQRVLALPPQNQAEELLERAIGHDTRALELFNQQVESWIGHINKSDRLSQLEQRSRFSKDLRVRYANADINLALEGWQKNQRSADLLIDRARTDSQYRAAAVYFLGMLAGRGVDYERIHDVLLGYARNDPDALVRQWAVEGMRYLGKDEVLDELFSSFTEDPAMNVRDRAGCNISDCGNFTRKQRMRMAPQLIDLAANPSATPQMRTWCFMALREITNENLPDAMAWRNWYQDHGAEKMAAFERLDWWQVQGDE